GYYPWLYHALVALLARFTPGGRAFDALGPLQLLQVTGTVLGLVALGRLITERFVTGVAAAVFGALSGGFGVGMLLNPPLIKAARSMDATKIPWLGDILARRPYNFAFNNLAPAYPRDVSFSLLVAFLLLLVLGLRTKSTATLAASGVVLGLVGLAGGEAIIVGAPVAVVVCLCQGSLQRGRASLAVLAPMLAIYATWLGPIVVNYIRFGGFVNTTHVGNVVLTFPFLLLSWGLATPFALIGIAVAVRSPRDPGMLVPVAVVVVTAVIMVSNAIPEAFGTAFSTLGRDHRYWSLCQLGVALLAAVGATVVFEAWRNHRLAAVSGALVVVLLGIVSPALGSTIYPYRYPPIRLIGDSLRGDPTLLNALAPSPDRRCVVAVRGNFLAREVFAYTGYRLVQWVVDPTRTNWARIRWRDIYRYIPGDRERLADNRVLTTGSGPVDRWEALARKYRVNFVVVPQRRSSAAVFDRYPRARFSANGAPVTLVRVKDC
ncbi:MAG: hypothetical protein M3P18_22230, partial [Actinomycetota bacterium]|nr:hypothetical protein [Actinomycetota bacterium]